LCRLITALAVTFNLGGGFWSVLLACHGVPSVARLSDSCPATWPEPWRFPRHGVSNSDTRATRASRHWQSGFT